MFTPGTCKPASIRMEFSKCSFIAIGFASSEIIKYFVDFDLPIFRNPQMVFEELGQQADFPLDMMLLVVN
jgi:hypothetical protein